MEKRSLIHQLTLEEVKNILASAEEKPFRAAQLFHWIYEKGVTDWEKMSDFSKSFQQKAASLFSLSSLHLEKQVVSQDQETIKFLWTLSDDKQVESVLINSHDRRTVCVSSQVGCPARCAFCASGKEGLIRNLSAAEIFEQVYQIDQLLKEKKERVSHVVFMGMGEPFENYDEVLKAVRLLCSEEKLNLSQRRITISTVGVIEGIQKLMGEELKVNLVLSLHAPNQHLRKKIIPYARKYPLEEILEAMVCFSRQTKRDVTYEYTLLSGINDQPEQAKELAKLLKGQQCTINLIPYNPVIGLKLKRPEKEVIEDFRAILSEAGQKVTWRYTKGKDIAAACGQLALQKKRPLEIIP